MLVERQISLLPFLLGNRLLLFSALGEIALALASLPHSSVPQRGSKGSFGLPLAILPLIYKTLLPTHRSVSRSLSPCLHGLIKSKTVMKETKTNRPMLTFEDGFGSTGLSKAQLCLTWRPRISDTHSHQTWTWDNGFWVHRPMPMEINAADSHGDQHSRSRLYKKSDNLKQGEKQREGEIPKVWVGLLREERKC